MCVAWRGVAWRGVAWRGVAWRGAARRDAAWLGGAGRGVAWRGAARRGAARRGAARSRSSTTNANENICCQKKILKRNIKNYTYTIMNAMTYTAVLCDFLGCKHTLGGENKKLN